MLPPMKHFDWNACPAGQLRVKSSEDGERWVPPQSQAGRTVPELLQEFFRFYRKSIDWTKEAVSVRRGKRGLISGLKMMPYQVVPTRLEGEYAPQYKDNKTTALAIEDPFEPMTNLSTYLSSWGLSRMRQEITRAYILCQQQAGLTVLLDPWIPPEHPNPEPKKPFFEQTADFDDSDNEKEGGGAAPWRKSQHKQPRVVLKDDGEER